MEWINGLCVVLGSGPCAGLFTGLFLGMVVGFVVLASAGIDGGLGAVGFLMFLACLGFVTVGVGNDHGLLAVVFSVPSYALGIMLSFAMKFMLKVMFIPTFRFGVGLQLKEYICPRKS